MVSEDFDSHPLPSHPSFSPSSPDSDSDSDDTPLTYAHLAPHSSALPRRGTKDFESHGTNAQLSVLESSRQAMHDALSVGRVHGAKGGLVGWFDVGCAAGDGGLSGEDDAGRGEKKRGRFGGKEGERLVFVEKPSGQHIRTMGKADREGRLWLLPEEVVYLVERGSLDVRYRTSSSSAELGPEEKVGDEEAGEGKEEKKDGWDGVGMSLQACYAWFIGRDGLDLERYNVFAGLRRSGYIVLRAPGWYGDHEGPPTLPPKAQTTAKKEKAEGIWQWLYKNLLERKPQDPPPLGPLVGPGLYRSYSDIYRLLHIIPSHDPSQPSPDLLSPSIPASPSSPRLRLHFHVYKPISSFRKSAPGPPDFYICVLNAREDSFPALTQLDGLLQSVPYAPPPESERRSYQRLKHGYRNVVLAVVDQGVTSYMRVADAGFGKEKMYERVGRPGGQGERGGGRERGRGRGRGRGR